MLFAAGSVRFAMVPTPSVQNPRFASKEEKPCARLWELWKQIYLIEIKKKKNHEPNVYSLLWEFIFGEIKI